MRKTKILALLLVVAIVASMVVPSVSAEDTYEAYMTEELTGADSATVEAGQKFAVYVSIAGNPGISAITMRLQYPEGWSVSYFEDCKLFDAKATTLPTFTNANPYYLQWVMPYGTTPGRNDPGKKLSFENGDLCLVEFEVPADALSGEYELSLSTEGLGGDNYKEATDANGVIIEGGTAIGNVCPDTSKKFVVTVQGTEPEVPAGAACSKHTDVTEWTNWAGEAITESGHYKLTESVELAAAIEIAAGVEACIDLNGNKLTAATKERSFVNEGTLVIMDSSAEQTGEIIGNTKGTLGANIYSTGDFYLYSGTISGATAQGSTTKSSRGGNIYIAGDPDGDGVSSGAKAYLYGGVITGGEAHHTNGTGGRGGNIYVSYAEVLMDGVIISDGISEVGGNGYFENSTITIQGNTQFLNGQGTYSYAGAFYVSSSKVTIQGNAVIDGGQAGTGGGNIYATGAASELIIKGNAQVKNGFAGNAGGNVYCNTNSTLLITENAVIADGETNTTTQNWGGGNVYVFTGVKATISGNVQILGGTSVVRAKSIVARSSAVLTITGNVVITANNDGLAAINNYDSTIKIGAGVTTYSDPRAFANESEAVLTTKDAEGVTCYKIIEKLADALTVSVPGDKITLAKDATVGNAMVKSGVTVDLNGKTLTATGGYTAAMVGTQTIDSVGGGKLITPSAAFTADNAQLPVGVNGEYVFENVEFATKYVDDGTKATYKFYIKNVADATMIDDAIKAGETVGLEVKVNWTVNGEAKYKVFTLDPTLVEEFAENWDTKAIVLTINDITGISDVVCTAQVTVNGVTVTA